MTDTTDETTPDRLGPLRNARARIAENRARREALPESICRVCGDRVQAGEGVREPEPEFTTIKARDNYRGSLRDLPAAVDGWRRTCPACVDADARGEGESFAMSRILGTPVAQADAREVWSSLSRWVHDVEGDVVGITILAPTARATGRWSGRPWGHITPADREIVADALARVIARTEPRRCQDGSCGLCGRSHALRWHESRMTWPDRSTAPVCDTCRPTYLRRGAPHGGDDLARIVVELLTGQPVPLGNKAPEGVRAFCESRHADRAGTPEPWQYAVKQIADLRHDTWRRRPDLAPGAMREAALAWHADYLVELGETAAAAEIARQAQAASGW